MSWGRAGGDGAEGRQAGVSCGNRGLLSPAGLGGCALSVAGGLGPGLLSPVGGGRGSALCHRGARSGVSTVPRGDSIQALLSPGLLDKELSFVTGGGSVRALLSLGSEPLSVPGGSGSPGTGGAQPGVSDPRGWILSGVFALSPGGSVCVHPL